ncbi:hypothetical protein [Streptomyces cucumeris]|uniref:hypothetical protein n=1 Tax=Streptomyces cucumeris TaxID=2962890 RepID=UPI0020C87D51|nr:hypothetical protein [Streptomyces sp. NEAU-Y11]MCP9213211.1 hypothetical protein [Streptomyces sp. NEAU-Y11]
MAEKVIDVTLASMTNTGDTRVNPVGFIMTGTARAGDDQQVFDSGLLFDRTEGQPLNSSGVQRISPGESVTFNTTKRLTVSHPEEESEGHLKQMLLINADLTQKIAATGGVEIRPYFGCFMRKVLFDELDGFETRDEPHSIFFEGMKWSFTSTFTINVISSSG